MKKPRRFVLRGSRGRAEIQEIQVLVVSIFSIILRNFFSAMF
jgi:hypothetical protein